MTEQPRARLNSWLVAENTDLRVDNAALRDRLDKMREERDAAQRANRKRSLWGAGVALWDRITGRDR